ncbi:MAG: MFS transporter [Candidatus Methanomethylicus sp.]|nr:MFS transporter [Candidatus Methanomethylicus sp.]
MQSVSKKVALFITTLAGFLTPFDVSSVNIALPTIGKEFSMDAISLNWVTTAYLLSSATFLIIFGRIADIYGRKRIFSLGISIFIVSSLAMSLSISPLMLILFRLIQGIGGAMIASTSIAILTCIFPLGERGKALGLNSASIYVGLSIGPTLGGIITQYLGWRIIFLVNVPLGLAALFLIYNYLRVEWCDAKGERVDYLGSAIYGFTLIAITYGVSILPSTEGIGLVLAGFIGLFAFIRYESSATDPVLNLKLFKGNRVFALSNLAALINYSSTFAVTFLISLYLQYIRGLDPWNAGLIMLCSPLVQAFLSPFTGRLSDRMEPRILSTAGMAITTLGLALLTTIGEGTSEAIIAANLSLLGLGFALFVTPNTNAIMSSVEKKFLGVAAGTLSTMRQAGMTLSMGFAMLVFALYIGRIEITPTYYPAFLASLRIMFVVFAFLCAIGIIASASRGKVKR